MFKFLDKLLVNKGLLLLLSSIALALACVELCVAVKKGKVYARQVVTTACKALVIVACALGLGFLMQYIPLSGLWAKVLFYAFLAVVLAAVIIIYVAGERKQVRLATANALRKSAGNTASVRHAKSWIFASCFAFTVGAALLLAFGKENYYMAMVPVAITALAVLLHAILHWRLWYALAALAVIAFGVFALMQPLIAAALTDLTYTAPSLAALALLAAGFITLTFRRE